MVCFPTEMVGRHSDILMKGSPLHLVQSFVLTLTRWVRLPFNLLPSRLILFSQRPMLPAVSGSTYVFRPLVVKQTRTDIYATRKVREELLNNVFLNVSVLLARSHWIMTHMSSRCQDNVHGNVRLAFHDAGGFSQALVNAGEFG